jgi:hypothetical protein
MIDNLLIPGNCLDGAEGAPFLQHMTSKLFFSPLYRFGLYRYHLHCPELSSPRSKNQIV